MATENEQRLIDAVTADQELHAISMLCAQKQGMGEFLDQLAERFHANEVLLGELS